ncbi:hypothetical protein LOD99_3204 [Oopsacas minuta]|uniref:Mediator of RNA polymerase II transcription subunit 19 n=1 Tax=Oopsacas minuta TaxID=111878 RepID=A0AAV7JY12_9METZ|nr:hypothetical protein LOD99_3204 [Oopsacas minuta]
MARSNVRVDVSIPKPPIISARDLSPPSTQDRVIREGLGGYLQNIPGNLNTPGPEEWSLQHLIAHPPRGEMELSYFCGAQFMGFILKEGLPIPDHLKVEPSTYGTGSEKVKKKHKSKKHKANQPTPLNHLLDKIPPDASTSSSHGEAKIQFDSETIRRKDKKNKKKSKKEKDVKKKKKIKHKDEDDRPDKPSLHFNNSFTTHLS